MTDAQAWLDRHTNRPQLAEPTRDEYLLETLGPGDVTDAGRVIIRGETEARAGIFWLPLDKAMAACYYGWEWKALSCEVNGRVLWKVEKW